MCFFTQFSCFLNLSYVHFVFPSSRELFFILICILVCPFCSHHRSALNNDHPLNLPKHKAINHYSKIEKSCTLKDKNESWQRSLDNRTCVCLWWGLQLCCHPKQLVNILIRLGYAERKISIFYLHWTTLVHGRSFGSTLKQQ